MNVKENRSLPTKSNIEVYSRGQHNKNVLQFFFMVLVQMENLAFQGVKKMSWIQMKAIEIKVMVVKLHYSLFYGDRARTLVAQICTGRLFCAYRHNRCLTYISKY